MECPVEEHADLPHGRCRRGDGLLLGHRGWCPASLLGQRTVASVDMASVAWRSHLLLERQSLDCRTRASRHRAAPRMACREGRHALDVCRLLVRPLGGVLLWSCRMARAIRVHHGEVERDCGMDL